MCFAFLFFIPPLLQLPIERALETEPWLVTAARQKFDETQTNCRIDKSWEALARCKGIMRVCAIGSGISVIYLLHSHRHRHIFLPRRKDGSVLVSSMYSLCATRPFNPFLFSASVSLPPHPPLLYARRFFVFAGRPASGGIGWTSQFKAISIFFFFSSQNFSVLLTLCSERSTDTVI